MSICSVCFYPLEYLYTIKFKCSHEFHKECTMMWLREHKSCPICRTPVELELVRSNSVFRSSKGDVLYFRRNGGSIAVNYGTHIYIENSCFAHSVGASSVFAVSEFAFACVRDSTVYVKTLMRESQFSYYQFLLCYGQQLRVRFFDLQICGDYLYCVSPVYLVVIFISAAKVAFTLRFDHPLIFYRHPFYLFYCGFKTLEGASMCAFRKVNADNCYKFDFYGTRFVMALADGRIVSIDIDTTVSCEFNVGLVNHLVVGRSGFCFLQDHVLKAYGNAGETLAQIDNVTWLEKSDGSRICYSSGCDIYEADFLD